MAQMYDPPHPGSILKNELTGRSVTQTAKHLGVSRVTLSRILNEQSAITAEMSIKLSEAFNTSPDLWYKMQTAYDFWQASHKRRKKIAPLAKVA
jgi:antitoxin HigA-1